MFLIDTNVFSELIRPRPNLPVVRRLLSTDPEVLFACEMTRYELRFRSGPPLEIERDLGKGRARDSAAADLASDRRAGRPRDRRPPGVAAKDGNPIDIQDAFLAATALVHDLVLVTRNVRHFQNIADLVVENWFPAEGPES
jgi:predicted nucleic acid-binding protein